MSSFPYFVSSYPRSGNTWLRFILCHLFFPKEEGHTIASVDRLIPYVDDPQIWKICVNRPCFIKTHRIGHNRDQVIWIHRHVGDVLISEWWYKKKFGGEDRSLSQYLEADGWGAGWRANVDYHYPCRFMIGYDEIKDPVKIYEIIVDIAPQFTLADVAGALEKSSFHNLQQVETHGFGIYPSGDLEIKFFRQGHSGQWKALPEELQQKIIQRNYCQLRMLGYEHP